MTTTRSELYQEAKTKGWITPWNKSKKADLQKFLDDIQPVEEKKTMTVEDELINVMPPELLGIIRDYVVYTIDNPVFYKDAAEKTTDLKTGDIFYVYDPFSNTVNFYKIVRTTKKRWYCHKWGRFTKLRTYYRENGFQDFYRVYETDKFTPFIKYGKPFVKYFSKTEPQYKINDNVPAFKTK